MAGYGRIMSNGCHFLNGLVNKAGNAIKSPVAKPKSMISTKRNRPMMMGRKSGY